MPMYLGMLLGSLRVFTPDMGSMTLMGFNLGCCSRDIALLFARGGEKSNKHFESYVKTIFFCFCIVHIRTNSSL